MRNSEMRKRQVWSITGAMIAKFCPRYLLVLGRWLEVIILRCDFTDYNRFAKILTFI